MNTTSYWIDSFSLPHFPSLGSSPTVDVVVIGGGLTGITAAYLLKRTGLTVALVERERCASLDTGHTTAHLTCVTDLRLQQLADTFGREPAHAVWDAGAAAIDQIANLIRSEDIACDFKWVPAYLHAPKKEGGGAVADKLKKEASVANELGLQATFLDAIPFFDTPGVKFPHQAFFHPRRYLAGLLRTIPGNGSFVFEKTAVEEIQEKPLVVKSGGHQIHCRQVVIATHVPLMGASGLVSAALFQTKLYPYTTYALGAKLPRDSIPEASYWDTNEPYSYLRVERRSDHDYAIFGGQDHKTGQVEDTKEPFHQLEKRFLEFAPQAKIDHRWSGQVIETNDGLPYIGETAENQFVATGFSGNGMTFGTLGAMMAVDSIVGRKNPWQDIFEVHRKKLLGGTWEYLKENADYPYYMLRDRIAGAEGDSLSSLKKGEGKILKLDGKKVAAYRDAKGRVTLCSPICTHLQCIVSWNNAEQTWDCPCHGSRFKATGEVMTGPAEEDLEKTPELAN